MLNALVRGSLHYRVVVLIVAVVLLAVGVYSIQTAKYDVFPEFIPPMVVVQTEAPGFSPQDVEALVTRPIEYSLNGTAGIKTSRPFSRTTTTCWLPGNSWVRSWRSLPGGCRKGCDRR